MGLNWDCFKNKCCNGVSVYEQFEKLSIDCFKREYNVHKINQRKNQKDIEFGPVEIDNNFISIQAKYTSKIDNNLKNKLIKAIESQTGKIDKMIIYLNNNFGENTKNKNNKTNFEKGILDVGDKNNIEIEFVTESVLYHFLSDEKNLDIYNKYFKIISNVNIDKEIKLLREHVFGESVEPLILKFHKIAKVFYDLNNSQKDEIKKELIGFINKHRMSFSNKRSSGAIPIFFSKKIHSKKEESYLIKELYFDYIIEELKIKKIKLNKLYDGCFDFFTYDDINLLIFFLKDLFYDEEYSVFGELNIFEDLIVFLKSVVDEKYKNNFNNDTLKKLFLKSDYFLINLTRSEPFILQNEIGKCYKNDCFTLEFHFFTMNVCFSILFFKVYYKNSFISVNECEFENQQIILGALEKIDKKSFLFLSNYENYGLFNRELIYRKKMESKDKFEKYLFGKSCIIEFLRYPISTLSQVEFSKEAGLYDDNEIELLYENFLKHLKKTDVDFLNEKIKKRLFQMKNEKNEHYRYFKSLI